MCRPRCWRRCRPSRRTCPPYKPPRRRTDRSPPDNPGPHRTSPPRCRTNRRHTMCRPRCWRRCHPSRHTCPPYRQFHRRRDRSPPDSPRPHRTSPPRCRTRYRRTACRQACSCRSRALHRTCPACRPRRHRKDSYPHRTYCPHTVPHRCRKARHRSRHPHYTPALLQW